MAITLEQAKNLQIGDTLLDGQDRNKKGEPAKWRVNGKVKIWKRSPGRVRVPLKHGLYSYRYLTERNLDTLDIHY